MNAGGTNQHRVTNLVGSDVFDDVSGDHRANQAIGWAYTYGITSGAGEGLFDPDGTVTRAQIVTFLLRTARFLQNT